VSYDESEHTHPDGYAVVELTDVAEKPYGYYVMADSVAGKWEPIRQRTAGEHGTH
jgi:hypothetical protein